MIQWEGFGFSGFVLMGSRGRQFSLARVWLVGASFVSRIRLPFRWAVSRQCPALCSAAAPLAQRKGRRIGEKKCPPSPVAGGKFAAIGASEKLPPAAMVVAGGSYIPAIAGLFSNP